MKVISFEAQKIKKTFHPPRHSLTLTLEEKWLEWEEIGGGVKMRGIYRYPKVKDNDEVLFHSTARCRTFRVFYRIFGVLTNQWF